MTQTEYDKYMSAFHSFMEREALVHVSPYMASKPYFSHSPCDCCGAVAGMREDCGGYCPETEGTVGPFGVCESCVYFAEYGQLDDKTMSQIGGEV